MNSQPDQPTTADDPSRFINRELSWLAFNRRVVEEAQNPNTPLLERAKFLAISSNNLEEFLMVRVAGLMGQVRNEVHTVTPDGRTVEQQLAEISSATQALLAEQQSTWSAISRELAATGIEVLDADSELSPEETAWLAEYFRDNLVPVLTPIAVDPAHPFPFIRNLATGILVQLKMRLKKAKGSVGQERRLMGLIVIPNAIDRFVQLPNEPSTPKRFVHINEIIRAHLIELFPGMEIGKTGGFQIIRDSDLDIEEEAEDLVRLFETALRRRQRGEVVHMTINRSMPDEMLDFLRTEFDLDSKNLFRTTELLRPSDLFEIANIDQPRLRFRPFNARFPERLRDFENDCFAAIAAKDFIVHHPFESFDVVVRFLRQAANDPNVVAIKQTLYRTSRGSPIVAALIEAAEAGKSVTALVELKARFDEAANIKWARDLERAGVQVVYGFIELKTHAKISLVSRKETDGGAARMVNYAHFGTGNYHPITARIYTDLSMFTNDQALCADASKLFNYMTSYAAPVGLTKMSPAPLFMREALERLIDAEIKNAAAGEPAAIWAKMNSLVDPQIIDRLYEASCAGVNIELIVRGICCLRPGVPNLSENIRVRSVVGRYLEHSRIFCFANGHALPSRKAKVYISSADWMPRNLNRRVETMVPIETKTVHQQVLDQIMVATLRDTAQTWFLQPDGTYQRVQIAEGEEPFSAHEYFMTNPSLSGRGRALKDKALWSKRAS